MYSCGEIKLNKLLTCNFCVRSIRYRFGDSIWLYFRDGYVIRGVTKVFPDLHLRFICCWRITLPFYNRGRRFFISLCWFGIKNGTSYAYTPTYKE